MEMQQLLDNYVWFDGLLEGWFGGLLIALQEHVFVATHSVAC